MTRSVSHQELLFDGSVTPLGFLKVFCVHGGLFSHDGVTLDAISKTKRDRSAQSVWCAHQLVDGSGNRQRMVSCVTASGVILKTIEAGHLPNAESQWHSALM